MKIAHEVRPKLEFRFIRNFFNTEEGDEIQLTRNNRVIVTKKEDTFFLPLDDDKTIPNIIRKNRFHLSEEEVEDAVRRYMEFHERKEIGEAYTDESVGITVTTHATETQTSNIMNGKTPHRFIAKVAYEVLCDAGLQDHVEESEILKEHALVGGRYEELEIREGVVENEGNYLPIHVISNEQHEIEPRSTWFFVQFFTHYGVGVKLTWKDEPRYLRTVNVIQDIEVNEKKLHRGLHRAKAVKDGYISLRIDD